MEVKFKKSFIRDLEKLPNDMKRDVQELVFIEIPKLENLNEISQLKKIKGYPKFYRLRVRNYRVGFELRGKVLIFYRVLHRKNIYKYFP